MQAHLSYQNAPKILLLIKNGESQNYHQNKHPKSCSILKMVPSTFMEEIIDSDQYLLSKQLILKATSTLL